MNIKYAALYIHEENSIIKRYGQTFLMMKNSPFIDNDLPINFWAKAMDISNYLQNCLPTRQADKSVVIPKET